MNVAVVVVGSLAALAVGYLLYGRLLARLVGVDPARPTPAVTVNDGQDFVPTAPGVLFGHHYASIAAAGPIVGPTMALMYGAAPVWLWIVVGVILVGAVHDFMALFVAMREGGRSIAEVARGVFGTTGFLLYLAFALILCVLVAAAFLDMAAAALTSTYPLDKIDLPPDQTLFRTIEQDGVRRAVVGGVASTSAIVITACAPLVGWLLVRRKLATWKASALAVAICAVSVVAGFHWPVTASPKLWMGVLLAYSFIAGWIAVWIVLQPRDFVNVHFLWAGLALMAAGLVGAGLRGATIQAPAFNVEQAEGVGALGAMWPVLFVTVACGSVSGAHGLICGGTTCKQIASEAHARPIGYGGMLLEAVLGLLVLLCVGVGLAFDDYRAIVWPVDRPPNAPLGFAVGLAGTLDRGLGVPKAWGTVFGILLLEGFLLTTIDTIVRLSRYLLEELWKLLFRVEKSTTATRIFNTLLVSGLVYALAAAKGYARIWTLFGSANQLLAALTLVVATAWLARKGKRAWITAAPALFMIVTTAAALWAGFEKFRAKGDWVLLSVDLLLLALAAGFVVMTGVFLVRLSGRTRT